MNPPTTPRIDQVTEWGPIDDLRTTHDACRVVFEVWATRSYRIDALSEGDLCVWAEKLELRSESAVVAATITALSTALDLPRTSFVQQMVISPRDEEGGDRCGRVGFRVSLSASDEVVARCRALYADEVKGRWGDVVEGAAKVVRANVEQLQIAFDDTTDPAEPTPSQVHAAPLPSNTTADVGELARETLATELAASMAGKTFNFVLEAEGAHNEPAICSGRFMPTQRVSVGSSYRTLVGRVVVISKGPPQFKLRARELGFENKEQTWNVSYQPSDQQRADLADHFALPITADEVIVDVECFREQSVHGVSERFELKRIRRREGTKKEAADESSHDTTGPSARHADHFGS